MRAGRIMVRSGVGDEDHQCRRADANLGTVLDVALADALAAYERAIPAAQVAQHDPRAVAFDHRVGTRDVGVRQLQIRAAARPSEAEARLRERHRLALALARE